MTASFQFRNARLEDVLTALGELYGLQFAVATPVDQPVTLASPERIDAEQALALLDSALADLGKGILRDGDVVKIVPRGLLTARVELIRLQHANPQEVADVVTQIFQTRDLLTDVTAANQDLVRQLLPALSDSTGQLLIGQLKVVIVPYPQLKAVVVRAPEAAMPAIRSFIVDELDQRLPEPPKPEPPRPEPRPEPPPEQTRVYRLQFVEADYLAQASQRLLGFAPTVEGRINAVILKGREAAQFERLEELIDMLDVPDAEAQEIFHVTLNNAVASQVRQTLEQLYRYTVTAPFTEEALAELTEAQRDEQLTQAETMLVEAGVEAGMAGQLVRGELGIPVGEVQIVADEANNALLIRTHPRNLSRIVAVIEQLDRPRAQVMINVFIAEVRLDDTLELGVDFVYDDVVRNSPTDGRYVVGTDFGVRGNEFGLTYSFISDNINAFVRALQTTTNLDVVSRPQVLTLDNTAAIIEFGRRVPLIQTTQVTPEGTVNSTVRYEPVSTRLRVTPHINAAGFVRMEIQQSIDDVSAESFAISENLAPRVLITRKAETVVQVRDGQTVCLGGFIGDTVDETATKVPLLGDLPLVGYAFRSTQRTRVKSELLIFITPHVLRTPEQLLQLTNERRVQSMSFDRRGRDLEELNIQDAPPAPRYDQPRTRRTYTVMPPQP